MIIRTQDRTAIVNMAHVDTICISDNKILYYNGSEESKGLLGTYSTREKAIKVLDMMQEAYLSCNREHLMGNFGFVQNKVFEMPQDSEV